MTSLPRRTRLLCIALCALGAAPVSGQTALERTPNLSGGWIGGPQSLHFNFLHRFNHSGEPLRQVTNRPTFLLAYGAPIGLLIGAQYATRSDVVDRMPNEWEAFVRYGVLGEDRGHPVDVSAQAAYNQAAESWDGELSIARRVGPLRLLGAARVLSSAYGADTRYALAGGATLRIGQWLALAGDYGRLTDATADEHAAWGAAVQIGIPLTPHSVSIQRTNTNTATLHGASRGERDARWGFEFTVPIALRRFFGRRETVAPPPPPPDASPDSMRLAALTDSITREVQRRYEQRRLEDSVRFTLRDDSARLARELAELRRAASEDSARAAAEAARARAAAQDSIRAAAARQPPRPPPVRANIRNMAFAPATITVDVGTTIIWRNSDQVEHTVTAKDGSFDSGMIRPGGTYQRTFNRAGRFEYLCTPHPFMTAVVIVQAR